MEYYDSLAQSGKGFHSIDIWVAEHPIITIFIALTTLAICYIVQEWRKGKE